MTRSPPGGSPVTAASESRFLWRGLPPLVACVDFLARMNLVASVVRQPCWGYLTTGSVAPEAMAASSSSDMLMARLKV